MKAFYPITAIIVVMLSITCPTTVSFAQSSTSSDESDFIYDRNTVRSMFLDGENVTAYMYIQQSLTDKYPQTAALEYKYYTLVQEIAGKIGSEYMQVIMTTIDMSRAMYLLQYQNASNQLADFLLNSAASKGEPNAIRALQVKAMISGFGGQYQGNSTGNGYSTSRKTETCSLCHGKGWIAGSSTPTYGNTGQKVCPDCGIVNQSHSHDRCPACSGKGYR